MTKCVDVNKVMHTSQLLSVSRLVSEYAAFHPSLIRIHYTMSCRVSSLRSSVPKVLRARLLHDL